MFRFTLRDLLWPMMLVGLACALWGGAPPAISGSDYLGTFR